MNPLPFAHSLLTRFTAPFSAASRASGNTARCSRDAGIADRSPRTSA
jgi:hypothetical protein